MDRQRKVRLLAAGLCAAALLTAIVLTVILREGRNADIVPDGGDTYIPDYEMISVAEASRLFGVIAQNIEIPDDKQDTTLDCGLFSTLLFDACSQLSLDYGGIIDFLPVRLINAEETDKVALEDFLQVYHHMLAETKPEYIKELFIVKSDGKAVYDEDGKLYGWNNVKDYTDILSGTSATTGADDGADAGRADKNSIVEKHNAVSAGDFTFTSITAACTEDLILYVAGTGSQPKTLLNVWLETGQGSEMEMFIGGVSCTAETLRKLPQKLENCVVDITVDNRMISGVLVKDNRINGKVLLVNDDEIEIEGYGVLEFDDSFRMYKIYDELEIEKSKKILVGYSITDFIISGGKVCAALIKESLKADKIRVVLGSTGFKSLYHDSVEITADRKFTVERDGKKKSYEKGESVGFTADSLDGNERIKLYSSSDKVHFTISTIKRAGGTPSYRGSIEISQTDKGLVIVNELSLEEYLYAVIPSEMPTSYGLEALKVQAVCARSYAYNELVANRYGAYGAHVDDSVNCQVYNNISENESSIMAVKETYGEVMQGDNGIVSAYYFSTSSGCTADLQDVWQGGGPEECFTGRLQADDEILADSIDSISFADENDFRNFIDNGEVKYYIDDKEYTTSVDTFDSSFDWYRWQVFESTEDISARLRELYEGQDIGKLQDITVLERGRSGIVKKLLVKGDKSELTVVWQTDVRKLFAPGGTAVKRKTGSDVSNMSLLPSAFCYFDAVYEDGRLTGFLIKGGGYGHGCGMSQNGVKTMVSLGYTYDEIISHYYKGVSLASLP